MSSALENSQPLASDSFSFSWSLDEKFPFDGLREPMDDMVQPHRFSDQAQNFNFDVPKSSGVVVHADEIFSDGHMMPVYHHMPICSFPSGATLYKIPRFLTASSSEDGTMIGKSHRSILQKWRKSATRMLQMCYGLFKFVLRRNFLCLRRKSFVKNMKTNCSARCRSNNSRQASPGRSVTYSAIDWAAIMQERGKLDVENSLHKVKSGSSSIPASPFRSPSSADVVYAAECPIYEAILHCKRSFEK